MNKRASGSNQQSISFTKISKTGRIQDRLDFIVEKAERCPKKDGTDFFRFTLSNGKSSRIRAVSHGNDGIVNFNKLKEGWKYVVKGSITSKTWSRTYQKPPSITSSYYLTFWKLDIYEEEKLNEAKLKPIHDSNIAEAKLKLENRKLFEEEFKNVTIEDGTLYRYMGCETCTTSIRFPDKNGHFFCPKCKKKAGKKTRKVCMMLKGLIIKDNLGNVIEGIVSFEKVCKTLLGKNAEDFFTDQDARVAFEKFAGADVNIKFEARRKKRKTGWIYQRIATEIVVNKKIKRKQQQYDNGGGRLNNEQEKLHAKSPQKFDDLENELRQDGSLKIPLADFRALRISNENEIESYDVNSIPPGMALIINNYEFPERRLGDRIRKGSEIDVERLEHVLGQLGYVISLRSNVESSGLEGVLEEFKKKLFYSKVDSCIVVIMSHGNSNEIEMVDGKSINVWRDLVYKFSEGNFPEFTGKPKMFFVEACQQFELSENSSRFIQKPDRFSDILVCVSSLPGYSSKRYETKGTVFINFLVKMLAKHSHKEHMWNILKLVQRQMMQHFRNKEYQQICMPSDIMFNHFYFPNPLKG